MDYHCWQCGAPLTGMILPVSRREVCARCSAEIHVCRQCRHYAERVAGQCREDRAEDVSDKQRANFCDYYDPDPKPRLDRVDEATARARAELDALFGGGETPADDRPRGNPLDDLFDPDKLDS